MKVRPLLSRSRRTICEWAGYDRYSRPGLYDIDRRLARYLKERPGVFIEAGANDGYTASNTYYLERICGWRGLLIEGIPALYEQAKRCRKRSHVYNCALVPFEREGEEVEMTYGNLMSMVTGAMGSPEADAAHLARAATHDAQTGSYRVRVKGRALSSVIDECGLREIDFLSLDVEGFEAHVLRGLDLKRHCPAYILVEARFPEEIDFLLCKQYTLIDQFSPIDLLYRRRSQ